MAPRIRPVSVREDRDYYEDYYVSKPPVVVRRPSTRTFIAFILVQMFIAGGAFVLTRDYMSDGVIRQAVVNAFKQSANPPVENTESTSSENTAVAANEPKSKSVVIYQVTAAAEAPTTSASANVSNVTETATLPVAISPVEPAPVEISPVESAPVEISPVEPAPVAISPVESAPVEISPVESAPAPVKPAPVVAVANPVESTPAPVKPAPAPVVAVIPAPAPVVVSPVGSPPVAVGPVKSANISPATEEIISEPPAIAVPAPKKLASAEPVQQKLISSETSSQIETQALVKPPIPEPDAPAAVAPPESATPQQSAEQVLRDCEKCPELVMVGPGRFIADKGEEGKSAATPGQEKIIKTAFAIGRYEITFDDWDQCVADGGCTTKPSDSGWGLGRRPLINVSFNDISTQYLPWLSRVTGKTYRLPTEDEWEFAARGGASADASLAYSFGNDAQNICEYGNSFDLSAKTTESKWTGTACNDGFAATAPVGSKKPNALGLFDMHGNVWEWVSDCWHSPFSAQSANTDADCKFHVLRGGSWLSGAAALRSASRGWEKPDKIKNSIGFRVVRAQP
jgi:formylglycine-generating enzyme required for sulfatase activity